MIVKCKHCGKELPREHKGSCPYCGKVGKDIKVTAAVAIGVGVGKGSAKGIHKPKWSSAQLALFFGLVGILFSIVVPAILLLPPFSTVVNYGILVGFLLIASFVFRWKRYDILMFIRWLESKFGGEK